MTPGQREDGDGDGDDDDNEDGDDDDGGDLGRRSISLSLLCW